MSPARTPSAAARGTARVPEPVPSAAHAHALAEPDSHSHSTSNSNSTSNVASSPPPLPAFGKSLAHSDKPVRDKAVAALASWLRSAASVSPIDMLKLWKGLYYCYWMSDKPVIQHELADTLSGFLLSLPSSTAQVYLSAFWKIVILEWPGIDRLRIDKFFNLLRNFHRRSFMYLERNKWSDPILDSYLQLLMDCPLNPTDTSVANALRYHTCDVYLEELNNALEKPLPPTVAIKLLSPFTNALAKTGDKPFLDRIFELYSRIADTSQNNVRWEDEPEKKPWSINFDLAGVVREVHRLVQQPATDGVLPAEDRISDRATGPNKRTAKKICALFFSPAVGVKESDLYKVSSEDHVDKAGQKRSAEDHIELPASSEKSSLKKRRKSAKSEPVEVSAVSTDVTPADGTSNDVPDVASRTGTASLKVSPARKGSVVPKQKLSDVVAERIGTMKPEIVAVATRLNTKKNARPIVVDVKEASVEEKGSQKKGSVVLKMENNQIKTFDKRTPVGKTAVELPKASPVKSALKMRKVAKREL